MPTLGLFRKAKNRELEDPVAEQTAIPPSGPSSDALGKIYLKAMPLREMSDIESIRNEVKSGNILILRITPLANKSIEEVKQAVTELHNFAESIGGDIARLGEERVVICPPKVRVWREKTAVQNEALPTAA